MAKELVALPLSLSSEAGRPGALPGISTCACPGLKAFLGWKGPDIFACRWPKQRASSRLVYIC